MELNSKYFRSIDTNTQYIGWAPYVTIAQVFSRLCNCHLAVWYLYELPIKFTCSAPTTIVQVTEPEPRLRRASTAKGRWKSAVTKVNTANYIKSMRSLRRTKTTRRRVWRNCTKMYPKNDRSHFLGLGSTQSHTPDTQLLKWSIMYI